MHFRTLCLIALMSLPVFAQSAPDGRGWGGARLGMDYEAVKKTLREEGYSLRLKLGEYPGEENTYGKGFAATAPSGSKTAVKTLRVFGEKWGGKVWDLTIELKGVDPKAVEADLVRTLGEPERPGEYNLHWTRPDLVVTAFLIQRQASLHFLDKAVNERIVKQQLIDQGLEPAEP